MRYIFYIFIILFIIGFVNNSLKAQTLQSSYFLEGNNQRNDLNPAFTTSSNFVTFPALGNVYITANSNIGMKAIMRPQRNEMVTFLHPSIGVDDALSQFKKNNIIEADVALNIFKIGFNKWNGTNYISLNIRSQSGAYIPKTIFEFLKAGQTEEKTVYEASDINVLTQNYIEIGLGHAHKLNDKLSIGGKLKVLLGAGYTKAHINNIKISMSDSEWIINQSSTIVGSRGINFETKEDGEISNLKFDNFGIAGYGLGLDLGVVYKINKNFNISLAVSDIGFMNWNNCSEGYNYNKEFTYTGFDNIGTEDSQNFDDAADDVWDSLKGLVKYYKNYNKTSETTYLYSTIRAGGEYGIINNKISFGLLGSVRLGAPEILSEGMLTANFRPCKWFNGAINGSLSNTRSSVGFIANFHPKAVNFFFGMDYLLARYSKQFIPTDAAKMNIGFGLSFNY